MCVTRDFKLLVTVFLQFLVEQNNEFQKEKLQEDYNDSYPFVMIHTDVTHGFVC